MWSWLSHSNHRDLSKTPTWICHFPALVCGGSPRPKATLLSMAYRLFRAWPWSPDQEPPHCPCSPSPAPTPNTPSSCVEILLVPGTLMHAHLQAWAQAVSSTRKPCLPPCSLPLPTRPLSPVTSSRSFSWSPPLHTWVELIEIQEETPLVVKGLRLHAAIPGQGTKIPHSKVPETECSSKSW